MGERMTRDQVLEMLYHKKAEELKDGTMRIVNVQVPAREINYAQLIGSSETRIYQNLALHIGVHAGEDHTGESLGLMHIVPGEAVAVAADVAVKSGNVTVGQLDRFRGSLIILGDRSDVRAALEGVLDYFKYYLHFNTCEIFER